MSGSNWPTTSVRLVAALQHPEDQAAWERFSAEYAPALLQFCLQRGLQQADAEDITQSVFVVVYRKAGSFEFSSDRGRFRSWLSTIALRTIWKLQEQRQVRSCQLMDPLELNGFQAKQQQIIGEINESVIKLAVDEVQPEFAPLMWDAFSSVWFDGELPQTVAARMNRPASWVYKAKFHILQRLKAVISRIAHELEEF